MSDLLIRGMEMPTCCFKCGFYHHSVDDGYYDFEYCGANNAEFNNAYDSTKPHINPFEEKLSTCPLAPVPPHGRLIDADEFLKRAIGTKCFRGDYALMLEELVGESTTILEAEEVET